ncbi:hypothetical protein KKA14_00085 [bacterium]|nr:hypothetical protein [bacterium]
MTDMEIYQKFIDYLDNPIWKFTESEHKMPMITTFISPEEASFLTGFPKGGKTLEEIAALKNMDLEELTRTVKILCRKGLVYESNRNDSVRYRLWTAMEMFVRSAFWSGRDDEPKKSMAPHANKYYMDGWYDQHKPFVHAELRSIPINETITDLTGIMPFEDILKVVDKYEFYSVSHCPCRERHRLDPDYEDSSKPSEVCLHFDELGRYCVGNDLGREITKEETLEILKKAADAGLVHGVSNMMENPDTICNCDIQYCTYFKPYHQLNHDKAMDPSNYLALPIAETCKACGMCTKLCPMDAIQLKFSVQTTNRFSKAPAVDS